ncbi:MAG: hypothetical protein V4733_01570 [Verrucomicrobiota bacterium]
MTSLADESNLLIRCPSCGQRFKVGENLRDRSVECGACEHRFRVDGDTIVRARKVYPGEHRDPSLMRFQRVPAAVNVAKTKTDSIKYAPAPPPCTYEPASPQRIIAGLAGGGVMVLAALGLMFASERGLLADVEPSRRLIIACFAAAVGLALLVYANPRARLKALFFGGLLAAGLIAVPLLLQNGVESTAPTGPIPDPVANVIVAPVDQRLVKLRAEIGVKPLEKENEQLAAKGATTRAVGLWIRGLREQNRNLVRDHVMRTTGMPLPPVMYPRGDGNFLVVINAPDVNLEKIVEIATSFGVVKATYPELSVVEVETRNDTFRDVPIEKLTDLSAPEFYLLNKNELSAADPDRVKRAVVRLAGVEPKLYRPDISRKLIELMGQQGIDFKPEIARALMLWAEKPGPAGAAALEEIRRLRTKNLIVSDDLVELVIKEKPAGGLEMLVELWKFKPSSWEGHLGRMGREAEEAVIAELQEMDGAARHSAVRVLGRIGSPKSAAALKRLAPGNDSELALEIEKSLELIGGKNADDVIAPDRTIAE